MVASSASVTLSASLISFYSERDWGLTMDAWARSDPRPDVARAAQLFL